MGGALRDLSHEIDYLTWLLGGWERVAALGGQLSHLEIDSDDVYALLLATPACPVVTLQMNYLDRGTHRTVRVNTDRHTIVADLVQGSVSVDGACESFGCERDFTYLAMHRAALAGGGDHQLCALQQGEEVVRLIEAAEQAAHTKEWVWR